MKSILASQEVIFDDTPYDALLLVGSRDEESARRKQSLTKQTFDKRLQNVPTPYF